MLKDLHLKKGLDLVLTTGPLQMFPLSFGFNVLYINTLPKETAFFIGFYE